ncbi:Inositol 2-dehydrogenase/D-chiro-inositol 3-dehydrogenase [Castellaniella defragrans]
MSTFPTAGTPVKIGVLGCANIARQFIRDTRGASLAIVTAVASRREETARKFAAENAVDRYFSSYEAMLEDPDLEAIYLPLPNTLHAEWAIKAAKAGKHVLCEKPMAVSRQEAAAMFEAAHRSGTVLLEAYPYWFQPQSLKLRDLISSGAIGAVRSVSASFGFQVGNPDTNIRLKPDLGGGALLDAGSYTTSLVRLVMGCAPARVTAWSVMTAAGVDMSTMALFEYGDGRRAQISCAMDGANHRHATIVGAEGSLYTEYLNHTSDIAVGDERGYLPSRMQLRRGIAATIPFEDVQSPTGSGFLFEIEEFARMVRGTTARAAVQEAEAASLDIAATLEAVRESARSGKAVDLS